MKIDTEHPHAPNARVFFDDVELANCIEADEERGYAKCYIMEDRNRIRMHNGFPMVEILYGKVRIAFTITSTPPSRNPVLEENVRLRTLLGWVEWVSAAGIEFSFCPFCHARSRVGSRQHNTGCRWIAEMKP